MKFQFLSLLCMSFILSPTESYGFGKKKMQVSELKGVTETQVALNEGKASVLVRGKAAELIFRMMKEKQEEQTDTDALKTVGGKNSAQLTVKGKQVTCSKISKKDASDYACAFELDQNGSLSAANEAFAPATFNLARTETGSKLFKKKKNRSLASVAPAAAFNKGQAYLVYDEPGQARSSENAMIVFRGEPAKGILGLLESEGAQTKDAHWGDAHGRKGNDIACVGATGSEPERCAMVVTFRDGSVTHSGNPLFR